MSSPDAREDARLRYIAEFPRMESAALALEQHLKRLLAAAGVRGVVEVRAKTIGSFVKKAARPKYTDPWAQITDKVGGRVIVKTLDDLDTVRTVLVAEGSGLTILDVEDKSLVNAVDSLYYPGVHIQTISPSVTTADGASIDCEIQVRTKAQDLWSVPSHELVHKGALELSRETLRRVLRLSVLTEMFDEEVRTAMREARADPRYECAVLVRAAEALYLRFVAEPGEDELSMEVVSQVLPSLPVDERRDYPDELALFVTRHALKLADLFESYGAHSAFAGQFAYWLFSQPEALIVLERAEATPYGLADAVRGSDLEGEVRRLCSAWGVALPDAA